MTGPQPLQKINILTPIWLALVTLVLLITAIGVWSVNATISGAVIARGRMSTVEIPHEVRHPAGGIISHVAIREGQRVEAGEVIMRLDGTLLDADLFMTTELIVNLLARQARLEAARAGHAEIIPSAFILRAGRDMPGLQEQIQIQQTLLDENNAARARLIEQEERRRAQVDQQLVGLEAQIAAVEGELALAQAELDRQRMLSQSRLVIASQLTQFERDVFRLRGELGVLTARKAESLEKRVESEIARSSLGDIARHEAQQELDQIVPELHRLWADRSKLLAEKDQLEVRAPISGYVHDMRVKGDRFVAQSGAPLVTIIPATEDLQAVVRVAAADIDQVHLDQETSVRFLSYNARALPQISGRVVSIAAEATVEPASQRSYFEIYVEVAEDDLKELPEEMPILNGMEVTAFIQTRPETPFHYVTRPVVDYLDLAFRDRS